MANNVPITAGSGTDVATDDVSSVHYQVVKLADGTEDSSTRILAGGGAEAGALRVTVASDSTGVLSVDDNGGSLTVDNADLTAAAASLAIIDDWDESDRAKVNPIAGQAGVAAGAGAVGATTQRMTLASDDPAVALLGTMDADTSALAGAVSGSEMQVDVVASLPAGTNAIGKLAANDGVDIGDVDVASVVPGTGATNLGKAEDAAHSTGDVGVMALGVRKAADGPHSGADGDYEPLQTDENGYLKVNIKAGAGSGGTASTDDAAFTAGSGSGTPMMGFVTSDAVDSGDVGVVGMDANRNLKVSIEADNAGIGGGTQYTEDDATPTNPVGTAMMMERDDALAGLTPAEGDWTHPFCNANGAQWVKHDGDMPISDGGNVISVDDGGATLSVDDGGGALTVDNAGTFAVQAASAGDVAHDAADSGNPVKAGAKAIAHGSNPTAVAAADRTDLYANRHGVLFTMGGHPNMQTVRANYSAAQTNAAIVTVASGLKIVVTRLTVTADNANSVDVQVRIGFATATTPTTTDVVASHPGIPAGGGFTIGNGGGMLGVGADDEDLRITSEVPTGGSIDVVVSYFTIES